MRMWVLIALFVISWGANGAGSSPYVGQEQRAIKSLSTEEVDALRLGDGMGFAKAAELNEYPGPRHVLDLADELELSATQHEQTRQLFASMRADAIDLGERVIAAEAALDDMFDAGTVDRTALQAELAVIADLRARLRFVHLEAHLTQTRILSEEQVARYVSLRGYHNDSGNHAGHH